MSKSKDKRKERKPTKSPATRMWLVQAVPVEPNYSAQLEHSMYLKVSETEDPAHVVGNGLPIRTKTANAAARRFIRGMFEHQKALFQKDDRGPYGLRVDFE